mmetsp:Transcript_11493/g.22941  ORF Transcript_11493/g.22941 Transcript_11493/m.22941 type:complete len:451 (+) Transcript_11493:241-1593(+)
MKYLLLQFAVLQTASSSFLESPCSSFSLFSPGSQRPSTFINTKIIYGIDKTIDHATLSENDAWEQHLFKSTLLVGRNEKELERKYRTPTHSYVSRIVREMSEEELETFLSEILQTTSSEKDQTEQKSSDKYVYEPYRHLRLLRRRLPDPLWAQIKLEANHALANEPDAGPQLYQHILRQPSLMDALASIISHEIETELIPATAIQALVLDQLLLQDDRNVHLDVIASANRNPSSDATALSVVLFHQGLHALVCYRVAHRLWQAGRTGMAYYMQSTVSSRYSADIHPAAEIGGGTYLNIGGGIVIGETARVGDDVTILQGCTLGGTGKEAGDRHPKVESGVILHCGATILGNLRVGTGAVVAAKSIVTKEVPDLARVSGVPAKVKSYRELKEEGFKDDAGQYGEDENEECDLDCRFRKSYRIHLVELESLAKMESCLNTGNTDCIKNAMDD